MKQVDRSRMGRDDPFILLSTLNALRWKADTKVMNPFGDNIWLKTVNPAEGKPYITDCCFVEDPCPKHLKMQKAEDIAKAN